MRLASYLHRGPGASDGSEAFDPETTATGHNRPASAPGLARLLGFPEKPISTL